MTISIFLKELYKFTANRYSNQFDFFRECIANSVDEAHHDFINDISNGTISKYLNGQLSFSSQAKKILTSPDIDSFSAYLSSIFHNDDQLIFFSDSLKREEKFIDAYEVASYFYDLLSSISNKKRESKSSSNQLKENSIDLTQSSLAGLIMKSNSNDITKLLDNAELEIKLADIALNKRIPDNISKDFEYKILRNNASFTPELLAKNKNAFQRHKLSLKYHFNDKKDSDRFLRTIQKAEILKKPFEVKSNSVERYIDDFKDEFYDSKRFKQFILPNKRKSPVLTMSLSLDNGHFSQYFDKLILKEQEIKENTLIYTNIDDNNWLFIKLSIDCSKYEDGLAKESMVIGIKKNYATNIDYYKNYHKCDILMNDNNTHIILKDVANNNNFIDTKISNRNSFKEQDYIDMMEMFNSYDKISKIQETTGIIFKFNPTEYIKNKPTYDVAYACVMNTELKISTEMIVDVIVSDADLPEYKVGVPKDVSTETDHMILFDQKITFTPKLITLKNAETIELSNRNGINVAKVKTLCVEIKKV